jgi:hypothetical protein
MAVQTPLQRMPPLAHEHAPFWQAVPLEQSVAQPPQLALSVCTFTQAPPQSCSPAGHATHAPPEQASPAEHTFSQAPQLDTSEEVSTHPLGDVGQ